MESFIINGTSAYATPSITALWPTSSTLFTQNGTSNGTIIGVSLRSHIFDAFLKSVCLLILSIGTVGNLIVVITFGMRRGHLKTCEIFMINLAIADLVGTACLPLITFFELQKISLAPIKHVGCQWLYTFNLTSLTVSAFTLVCIAGDRYIVVTRPFRTKPHKAKVVAVSLLTWLLSFTLGIVYLFDGVRIDFTETPSYCRGNMSTRSVRIHSIIVFFFQVLLPMVVMAVLYGLTLRALYASRTQALSQNNRMMAVRLKQNRRTTRLFITVVATFYTLILPHNIFMLIYLFNIQSIPTTTAFYSYYTTLMIHMVNSSVNPLIYARMHHSFRGAAVNFICCRTTSLSSTAWRSIIQTRKRLSSGWTKTTTVNSRDTATSELQPTLLRKNGTPSPVTESFSFNGTPRLSPTAKLMTKRDSNSNETMTNVSRHSLGMNNSRPPSFLAIAGSSYGNTTVATSNRSGYSLLSPDATRPHDGMVVHDFLTSL